MVIDGLYSEPSKMMIIKPGVLMMEKGKKLGGEEMQFENKMNLH